MGCIGQEHIRDTKWLIMSFLEDMAKYFLPTILKFKGSFIGIPAVGFLAIFKDAT